MPLRLATPAGTLSLLSTTTIFGTPIDVTLANSRSSRSSRPTGGQPEALRGLAQAGEG